MAIKIRNILHIRPYFTPKIPYKNAEQKKSSMVILGEN